MPQYASVPVDVDPSALDIAYTVLEELFIPDDESASAGTAARAVISDKKAIIELVNTSMKLTGNEKDTLRTGTAARSTYRPGGRVKVTDTRLASRGTPYEWTAPVRAFALKPAVVYDPSRIYRCNGYYSVNGTFKNPCNYRLIFECGDFDVRNGDLDRLQLMAPKRGAWDVYLGGGDLDTLPTF